AEPCGDGRVHDVRRPLRRSEHGGGFRSGRLGSGHGAESQAATARIIVENSVSLRNLSMVGLLPAPRRVEAAREVVEEGGIEHAHARPTAVRTPEPLRYDQSPFPSTIVAMRDFA